MLIEFGCYLTIGLLAGVLAGLMGVGGGLVIVPALWLIWSYWGWDTPWLMQLILGTSLACIVFISLSSTWAHHKKEAVIWKYVRWIAPSLVIGVWLGNFVAVELSQLWLERFISFYLLIVALKMLSEWKPNPARRLESPILLSGLGSVVGFVSALVGIGGGTLTVPIMRYFNVDMKNAIATSAACGFPIAIAATIGYALLGTSLDNLPSHSLGLIYWPAVIGISFTAIFTASTGAKLAHYLPSSVLQKSFACILLLISIKLWF